MKTITLSGPPGSGTTTAAKLLAKQTGYEYVNTGEIFRKLAAEYHMSPTQFGAYVCTHPEIDDELDRRQIELARRGQLVLEGRLSGHLSKRNAIAAFCVYLDAPLQVRAARVSRRDSLELELATRDMVERARLEKERYLEHYQIDLDDYSVYDLVIDSSKSSPQEIVRKVLSDIQH